MRLKSPPAEFDVIPTRRRLPLPDIILALKIRSATPLSS
jgi:hypothetical protein